MTDNRFNFSLLDISYFKFGHALDSI